jgi:signal transduction histidine kinase
MVLTHACASFAGAASYATFSSPDPGAALICVLIAVVIIVVVVCGTVLVLSLKQRQVPELRAREFSLRFREIDHDRADES